MSEGKLCVTVLPVEEKKTLSFYFPSELPPGILFCPPENIRHHPHFWMVPPPTERFFVSPPHVFTIQAGKLTQQSCHDFKNIMQNGSGSSSGIYPKMKLILSPTPTRIRSWGGGRWRRQPAAIRWTRGV